MAGTPLHVTLAARAADAVEDERVRAIALRFFHDYSLGAVLFDLPYFDRLLGTGLALALRRPLRFHPFGAALHRRAPAGFLLALLDRARSDPERALCFGALTHYAVDLVFHPEIERRLGDAKAAARDPDGLHRRLEDEMDLHCHFHLLGTSGIGTAYVRRALRLEPSPGWAAFARGAMAAIHADPPAVRLLASWRAQLALYGLTSSWGAAPWLKTLPADDPELLARSVALAEEAISRSAAYIGAGARYVDGSLDRAGFLLEVPDRCALDGGPAEPADI